MYDFCIRGGTIIDGTRRERYVANLYIRDGRIVAITPEAYGASAEFNAKGLIVAPGFLDIHSHSDKSFLKTPQMTSMLSGGVTFELCGLCGGSAVPSVKDDCFRDMESYASCVKDNGISIDVGMLIGHGTLRSVIAGDDMRQVTPEELDRMCGLLDGLLSQGALGLSLGLIYPPGSFCDTEEIIALAKVVRRHDKMLAVHMRNENVGIFEALDEMLHVAETTDVRLELSHLKLMGESQWGRAEELLTRIDSARERGIRVHCDQYPYLATGTGLLACVPKRAADGGTLAMERNFLDEQWFAELAAEGFPELYKRCSPERIVISRAEGAPEFIGKSVAELSREMELSIPYTIREILLKTHFDTHCHYFSIYEPDMLKILSRRDIAVGSDGTAYDFEQPVGSPHPRYAGTFPRALRLIREHGLMSLEDAVYKMTGLPASLLGVDGQFGLLQEGLDATVTVFDADMVSDLATFREPVQPSVGIELVMVRGTPVYEHGRFTQSRPGRVQLH